MVAKILLLATVSLATLPVADLTLLVGQTKQLKQDEKKASPERRAEIRRQIGRNVARMEAMGDAERGDARAQIDVAQALLQSGEPERALARGQAALELAPEDADAHTIVAEAHHDLGDYAEATQEAKRALAINPEHKGAQAVLALSKPRMTGAAARSALKKTAFGGGTGSASAAEKAGSAGAVRASAVPAASARVSADTTSPAAVQVQIESFLSSAHAREAAGDAAGARALTEKALALDPNNVEALITRSKDRLTRGQADGALADARKAEALAPKQAAAKLAVALALEATDAPAEEIDAAYKSAAELDPKFGNHHLAALARRAAKAAEKGAGAESLLGGALPGWARSNWPWLTLFALLLGGASFAYAKKRLS